jgi:hypothetical protein
MRSLTNRRDTGRVASIPPADPPLRRTRLTDLAAWDSSSHAKGPGQNDDTTA